jgi:hypothetical protein
MNRWQKNRMGACGVLAAGCAVLIVLVALADAGAPPDQPPASLPSGPTTQPADENPAPNGAAEDRGGLTTRSATEPVGVTAAHSALISAERMRTDLRVADLERTVAELARHIGGPTRDLTVRPDTSIDARMDRIERELGDLENRIARVERQFLNLERTIDRVERRR